MKKLLCIIAIVAMVLQPVAGYAGSAWTGKTSTEHWSKENNDLYETAGNVGVGVKPSDAGNDRFTVEGVTALGETTAPALTTGYGKLYVKSSDHKVYFKTQAGVEYDLTAAAGSGAPTDAQYLVMTHHAALLDDRLLAQGAGITVTDSGVPAGNVTISIGSDAIKDTMIDWGSGAGQVDADDMPDGAVNKFYTDAKARAAISCTATGLTYTSGTGVLSLTALYVIPTTTQETNWGLAYTHKTTEDAISGIVKVNGAGAYSAVTDNSTAWNGHITTEDAISGLVKVNGAGVYSSVTDGSVSWNAAYSHKTTEDALAGLVKCTGAGVYTAVADGSTNWNDAYTKRVNTWTSPLAFSSNTASIGGLVSLGTANYVIGSNATATALEYKDIVGTANEIDVTHAAGSITIGLIDPLAVNKGGTGKASFTQYGIVYADTTISLAQVGIGTPGQTFRVNGGGTGYEFATLAEADTLAAVTARGATTSTSSTFSGGLLATNATTALTIGAGVAGIDYRILFDGETNDGEIKWMEDENLFQNSCDYEIIDRSTLAAESLTNPNLTGGTDWGDAEDCTLADDEAQWAYSSGNASTLTQAVGDMDIAGIASRWYAFTYTVADVGLGTEVATITTDFAETATALTLTAGTHTTYFKSAVAPTDFVITSTLTTGQSFTLDTLTLKEITGGDLTANGVVNAQQYNIPTASVGLEFGTIQSVWAFRYKSGLGLDNTGWYFNALAAQLEFRALNTPYVAMNTTTLHSYTMLETGKDVGAGSTNVPGSLKLWSDGDNDYYTQFNTTTQTPGSITYTLPAALPAALGFLTVDSSGNWAWDEGTYALVVANNITYVPIGGDIEAYVAAATAGDTLILASGTYTITDDIDIAKGINIVGQGVGVTTVTCATAGKNMFDIAAPGATVSLSEMSVTTTAGSGGNKLFNINSTGGTVGTFTLNHVDASLVCAGDATTYYGIYSYDTNITIRDSYIYMSAAVGTSGANAVWCGNAASAETATYLNIYDSRVYVAGGSGQTSGVSCVEVYDSSATNDVIGYVYNCDLYAIGLSGAGSDRYTVDSYGGDALIYLDSCTIEAGTNMNGLLEQDTGSVVDVTACVLTGAVTTLTGTITYNGKLCTNDLYVANDIFLDDGGLVTLGTGSDMSIQYTGSAGRIDASLVAPSDLQIDCGAAKTLVLDVPVYKDLNIAGYVLAKPASSYPGIDTFRDSIGTDTTIGTYAFAIDEYVSGGFELQHDYAEGTNLVFHVHWQGIAAPAGGTDNVQWRLTYVVCRDGVTLAAAATIDSPDVAIDTRYRCYRTDFGAITGTNYLVGDQLMFNLYRVAAASDDYAGDCLIETAGVHYQVDTLGSRTITTK
jgi:hypothetical protein